jgi:hypothetical protein
VTRHPPRVIARPSRTRQNTLIVPGSQLGLEGYVRIWLGAREECRREGLRRVGAELSQLAVKHTGVA